MLVRKVGDLLSGRPLQRVQPQDTIRVACTKLRDQRIGALAVCTDDKLVGILSERDVIARVAAAGLSLDDVTVAQAMTPDPQTIDIDADVAAALGVMLDGHFRHLPVTENCCPVGMISMRDIPTGNRFALQQWRELRARAPIHHQSPTPA